MSQTGQPFIEETLLQTLARFTNDTTFNRLPGDVVVSVKQRIMDTLGICLAASAEALGDGVVELVESWGGTPQASLVCHPGKFPAPSASLVNGTLAHSLDFDDTHLPSVLHPSASIIPGALAIGEAVGASGRDVIAAAAVGYEICVRVGMAGFDSTLGNSVFLQMGWHATSICGALACAAIGAKLLGLDEAGIKDAIGISATMASGLIESNRGGGTVKRLNCGWAAHSGLTAALLAKHGFTSPATMLDGRFGFFNAFLGGNYSPSEVTEDLGKRWVTPNIFFKPYPVNHFIHTAIDAALTLKRKHGVQAEAIESIELGTASAPLRTIGEPREQKIRPENGYHAKFSGPFAVASALISEGGLGVTDENFTDEKARDPRYLALASKVTTFVDPECEKVFPYQFPSVLRIHLASGETLEERVMVNRGGPANPLSEAELSIKFHQNARRAISQGRAECLVETIRSFERLDQLHELMALTQPG